MNNAMLFVNVASQRTVSSYAQSFQFKTMLRLHLRKKYLILTVCHHEKQKRQFIAINDWLKVQMKASAFNNV